ncbi:MAG TPA: rhodanese-like domain-containing protein [Xanthobacteraceae bacterium]|nr:rhodanese-like domain-containing protein [Xanthobacteraceae bacterium]
MTATIAREELKATAGGAVLLEALPARYYLEGHLPGALHMPHDRVRALAPRLAPDKAAAIVVYCASDTCQNSHIAARTLESLGYTDVRVYAGGKKDWVDAGLPLETGGSVAEAA